MLITETMGFDSQLPEMKCIVEDAGNGTRRYKIHGIFLQAERLNGNRRIYPRSVMSEAVRQYNIAEQLENWVIQMVLKSICLLCHIRLRLLTKTETITGALPKFLILPMEKSSRHLSTEM